mgnify:CR=1 FL=1|tara:strand:+ start:166 stop:873 length:708 start_codon:yes stop_codon:yes gene_type:complete
MKNKNEKGFALVLALLLLLVMSLMGGSLIVVASGDHKSNNNSDQYQQAFYVAEMGLLQAEKRIIDHFKGQVGPDGNRDIATKTKPENTSDITAQPEGEDCYKSFKNIDPDTLKVTDHIIQQNFGVLISPILMTHRGDVDVLDYKGGKTIGTILDDELAYLKRFEYEYFIVNVGEAPLMVSGSSINVGQKDTMQLGTAYKLYACGIFYGRSILAAADHNSDPEIIIPLESIIIMPN